MTDVLMADILTLLMTLTAPMSRQFSLAERERHWDRLQTSRELWLLFRLITDSLLFLSPLKLLDMLRLGIEIVSVNARLRRKNRCLAVFFSILI